jgi:hypothetical protein
LLKSTVMHARRLDVSSPLGWSGSAADQVTATDLLDPGELAALERMLSHDERLRDRLLALLREHELDVAAVELDVAGGRVSLRGSVADPLTALLIEDLVWLDSGVRHCNNTLRPRDGAPRYYSGMMLL